MAEMVELVYKRLEGRLVKGTTPPIFVDAGNVTVPVADKLFALSVPLSVSVPVTVKVVTDKEDGIAVKGASPPMVVPDCKSVGSWVLAMLEEVVNTLAGILVKGVAPPIVVLLGKVAEPYTVNGLYAAHPVVETTKEPARVHLP